MSEVITKVPLSHNFLIACGPPPAESALFVASGSVGADRPISQVSECIHFQNHSGRNTLEVSLLQDLGLGDRMECRSRCDAARGSASSSGDVHLGLLMKEAAWKGPD